MALAEYEQASERRRSTTAPPPRAWRGPSSASSAPSSRSTRRSPRSPPPPSAGSQLRTAVELVRRVAAGLEDTGWQAAFCERIPVNARLLELGREAGM